MDLEQLEAFALGDRDAALANLVPGTDEHDYLRALRLQELGRFAEVDALVAAWQDRHGDTTLLERIRRRQLLHRVGQLEPAALAELRDELGVELDHQADLDSERPRHPTRLDPAAIEPARLVDAACRRSSDLSALTDHGRWALLDAELDATRRRALLAAVPWTPRRRMVELVAAELGDRSSRGFGALAIHAKLTRDQLDELARLRPELAQHSGWVDAQLVRRRPPAHIDWQGDLAARGAYLAELAGFLASLPPSFNSLRACVLWHQLDLDRRCGRYDRERFIAYLRVPRQAEYALPGAIARVPAGELASLGVDVSAATGLAPVRDEVELVRDYLHHLIATDEPGEIGAFLDGPWLRREQAIARLLAGAPDAEQWAKRLGASATAALRDRVDLDFALDNPTRLAADAPVALAVDVKNVPTLTVKVFRIDELAHFLAHGREVTTAIDLDGLTGSFAATLTFDAPPMQRVRRRIELPACAAPGTYVVELIGNGKSSRALIRKGRLRHAARLGAAGTVVTVGDEAGRPLPDAAIWYGGREYRADGDGAIGLPFSTRPGRAAMLLVAGAITSREEIELAAESYALAAAITCPREALAAGGTARAVARIRLTVAGAPAPIALLTAPRVEIATTDGQGVVSTREQPVVLADDRDAVIEWAMPPDVARVAITVRGTVRSVSEQRDVELSDGTAIEVAAIHRGSEIEALYLARTPSGWSVAALGKTGEPRPRRQVNVTLAHVAVTDRTTVVLDTDDRGWVELGALPGVWQVTAATAAVSATWDLVAADRHATVVRVVEGDVAAMPLPRHLDGSAVIAAATLVEVRGGAPARDATGQLAAEPGALTAAGLPAGEYDLAILGLPTVRLHVVPRPAPVIAGWAVLPTAMAELSPRRGRLGAIELADDALTVVVRDAGPAARVHVVATRFAPAPAGGDLLGAPWSPAARADAPVELRYLSGRDLGDEYRYVLERRTAVRRPGMSLARPGLLLNPWAVRSTSTEVAIAAAGTAYAPGAPRSAAPAMMRSAAYGAGGAAAPEAFASHDFLPRPPVVLANLVPDAEGRVRIPRAGLAGMTAATVYAIDGGLVSARWVTLAGVDEPMTDLRLRAALDPERHVIEKKDIVGLPAGHALIVDDLATARAEVVDTVAGAHRYLLSLRDDPALREHAFITRWPALSDVEKRKHYSDHACHELHLFLWAKDRAFFDAVIRPYLANKEPRTFLDRFLLGEDLTAYHEPWRLGRLNVVERCLLIGTVRGPFADALRRLVGDAVDLIPPDPERDSALVDALLGAAALATDRSALASALAAGQPAPELLADELAKEDRDDREEERAAPAKKSKSGRARLSADDAKALPAPPPAMAQAFAAGGGRGGTPSADVPMGGDLARREAIAPLYRGADLTREWAEHNYWHTRPAEPGADFIGANRFWRDLAEHRARGATTPFLSPHLGSCTSSFAEAMCALALLDLPFSAGAHAIATGDGRMTLTAASHALVARRQLAEVAPGAATPILIGQNLVRADDRYDWDGGEQREKYVTGELLAGVVYTCLVAVTNPTSAPARVDLLVQIPRGAMPVAGGVATRTCHLALGAYGTETHEYAFYFPRSGRFAHYPAHVAQRGELLAWAAAATYEVVAELSTIDPASWAHLAQRGTREQVVAFLATANLGRVDLARVAWRMKDPAWFAAVTAALAVRGVFAEELWAYALRHRDRDRLREWLEHQDGWLQVAGVFASGPVALDEAERGWHEHLEYAPLVNARAHRLGARARILNDGLAAHYEAALDHLARRPVVARDRARAAHYLFTQDRLDAALAQVERLPAVDAGAQLQLAYLRAYAACARGDVAAARALAAPHVEHPVDRWRYKFAALVALLDEAAAPGRAAPAGTGDPDSRDQRMADLASRQPTFELAVDRDGVVIDHRNLAGLELRFHPMELELLFSRQPFVQGDTARFSFITPTRAERIELAGDGRTRVAWPAGLARGSLVVEAVAAGTRKAVAHYMHDLLVTVAHAYGALRVARASDQAILPAAYVKVFARQASGAAVFYKDGYTDLAGRFDYATLSTDDLGKVERFAILVATDADGALVLEAPPPAR